MMRTRLSLLLSLSVTAVLAADGPAPRPRAEIYHDLRQRQATAAEALARAEAGVDRIEALLLHYDLTAPNLAQLISAATARRDELLLSTQELQQLVQRLSELLKLDPDTLADAITQARAQQQELDDAEARRRAALATATANHELQRAVSLDGQTARPFLLTGDKIAPFREPYFRAELIKVRLTNRRIVERPRYSRASDAGTIAAAVAPGGELHQLVNAPDFDRTQSYVTLWVCADAIAGYRTVVDFLQAHGVRYTWTPDVDAPWTSLDDPPPLGTWGYGGRG